jgi:transposase
VIGIIQRHIKTEVEWSEIERLDVIGIDEMSLKKGHNDFVTVVTARTDGRIIIVAVLKGRKKSTVKAFLASIPKRLKKKSRLSCFNRFLSTLDKWMDGITNYFINRQRSGFVEGFNNKIKVIKRRCYGILNVKHLFQHILLDLEGYSLFA